LPLAAGIGQARRVWRSGLERCATVINGEPMIFRRDDGLRPPRQSRETARPIRREFARDQIPFELASAPNTWKIEGRRRRGVRSPRSRIAGRASFPTGLRRSDVERTREAIKSSTRTSPSRTKARLAKAGRSVFAPDARSSKIRSQPRVKPSTGRPRPLQVETRA